MCVFVCVCVLMCVNVYLLTGSQNAHLSPFNIFVHKQHFDALNYFFCESSVWQDLCTLTLTLALASLLDLVASGRECDQVHMVSDG